MYLREELHINPHIVLSTQTLCGPASKFHPPWTGKVGRLGTVESMVESSMIAVWESDDDLTTFLHHLLTEIRSHKQAD